MGRMDALGALAKRFLHPRDIRADDLRGRALITLFLLNAISLFILYCILYFDLLGLPSSGDQMNPVFTVALPFHILVYVLSRFGKFNSATFLFTVIWIVGVVWACFYQPDEYVTLPLMYGIVPMTVAAFILPPLYVVLIYIVYVGLALAFVYPLQAHLVTHFIICYGIATHIVTTGAYIRIRIERDLQVQRAKAVHSSKLAQMGELVGAIAHEINTPLTVILGHAERIEKGAEDLEHVRHSTQNIRAQSHRIHQIVKGLMRYSRDGALDPFERTAALSILENVMSLCQHRLKAMGVQLLIRQPVPDLSVCCRSIEIEQVLVNLVGNSIDAVENCTKKEIEVSVEEKGKMVHFAVSDSGKGVPRPVQREMFRPFFTTKPVGQGTGLGLAISHDIIKAHGGRIWYDSSGGRPAFHIELPA